VFSRTLHHFGVFNFRYFLMLNQKHPIWTIVVRPFLVGKGPDLFQLIDMSTHAPIHIMALDATLRARIARLAFDAGHHAEIYASIEEFASAAPANGIGLVEAGPGGRYVYSIIESMSVAGKWVPIVAFNDSPCVPEVVRLIKSGAIDFVATPTSSSEISALIDQVLPDAEAQRQRRKLYTEARVRISRLSSREKQVFNHMASGDSNKAIARRLDISPRTVEVHRAKMMGKLGTQSIADVVRYYLITAENAVA
jgi:two-component system response regulator FixJ